MCKQKTLLCKLNPKDQRCEKVKVTENPQCKDNPGGEKCGVNNCAGSQEGCREMHQDCQDGPKICKETIENVTDVDCTATPQDTLCNNIQKLDCTAEGKRHYIL